MTTTIGFTINWWLVIGICFTMFFLLTRFQAHTGIQKEGTSKYKPHEALDIGRNDSMCFAIALIALMKYWNIISFNF